MALISANLPTLAPRFIRFSTKVTVMAVFKPLVPLKELLLDRTTTRARRVGVSAVCVLNITSSLLHE